MSEQNHYVEMMLKSLQKKIVILDSILTECEKQMSIISEENVEWQNFDECVDNKEFLIGELNKLDEGFTDLYERVKSEFQNHKDRYRSEISQMQDLIKQITDRSVRIQTEEERNRKAVEKSMMITKRDIKNSKATIKAASDYYKVMSKVNYVDPQFMDRKK